MADVPGYDVTDDTDVLERLTAAIDAAHEVLVKGKSADSDDFVRASVLLDAMIQQGLGVWIDATD